MNDIDAVRAEVQRLSSKLETAISQRDQIVRTGQGNLPAANAAVELLRDYYDAAQGRLDLLLSGFRFK